MSAQPLVTMKEGSSSEPPPQKPQGRLRATHKKSRYGCSNCKIRRVKCDESRPRCRKCLAFGVGFSYEPGVSEMQLPYSGSFRIDLAEAAPAVSPRPALTWPAHIPLAGARSGETHQLSPFDRAILHQFENTPILTVGTEEASMGFQLRALRKAVENPFLTHMIIATTLVYDIHVAKRPDRTKCAALAFYFYHGASLFGAKLAQPLIRDEGEALWIAAALTGTSAFADIKATAPAEAWPLGPTSSSDLDWIRLVGGKRAVFQLTNPTLPSSIHNSPCGNFLMPFTFIGDEMRNLPVQFRGVFALDENSTADNNPYHHAASLLGQLIPMDCTRYTVTKFLSFLAFPDARFLRLLEQRDPRALLLLTWWWAKALCRDHWWMWCRGILEGQALCIYLEMAFSNNPELLELLEIPQAVFAAAAANPLSALSPARRSLAM